MHALTDGCLGFDTLPYTLMDWGQSLTWMYWVFCFRTLKLESIKIRQEEWLDRILHGEINTQVFVCLFVFF